MRYVLEGSVRRIGTILRVNVQLTSAETGAHLWSDRFDEPITELAAGQEQIVTRMRSELGISMVEIEKARSQRERPTNPDAFDLILRARSVENLPPNPQRSREALALYERALRWIRRRRPRWPRCVLSARPDDDRARASVSRTCNVPSDC